ncbi:MAG TPA: hypothetical protein VGF84_13335, partial [Micromonosporaceae bacterium]
MSSGVLMSEPDEELVVTHAVVELPVPLRRRIITGSLIVLAGLITFFAWGLGAKNGDAAFQLSQFGDKYQVPVVRFPGGGAAMIAGVVITLLGLGQLFHAYSRRQLRWAGIVTIVLFVLAFLCWAATNNPALPISLKGLVVNSISSSIPFILGALAGI